MTVFGEDLLLERAGIHADPDRDAALTAGVRDLLYPVVRADIARIDTYFIHSRGTCLESELIVEVNVRDDRRLDGFL